MSRWRRWLRTFIRRGQSVLGDDHSRLAEALHGLDGRWVAVRDGEVVEARDSPYELVMRLRQQHISGAAIIRAPADDEPEMVGFG